MGMGINLNYGLLAFTLIFTAFLLLLTCINHSRDTKRYRILKLSLWILLASQLFDVLRLAVTGGEVMYPEPVIYVIFVGYYLTAATVMILIIMYMLMQFPQLAGRSQLLYTVFFICECTVTVLILSTNLTGFLYSIEGKQLVPGIGVGVFFAARLIALFGFLVMVGCSRSFLSQKLFQNWIAMLVLAVGIHLMPLFLKNLSVFGLFANVFWTDVFFLFHSGTYEEGTARMGADMYRSELGYRLSKKRDFYVFEIQIRNYEQLVERRIYSEEELDGFYSRLATRLTGVKRGVMVFQKKHTSLGVLVSRMNSGEAAEMAEKMKNWIGEFFLGKLVFGIAAVRCPAYVSEFVDVERMLRFLQKKCPVNNFYFCEEPDYEEFVERDEILRLLHDMHLDKEDVVLFGRPIIGGRSPRVNYFEILCRLQIAGNGILHSEHVIRLAEQYGYIHDVNMAVLAKVCDFLVTDTAIREGIRVSLHISSEELKNPGFAKDVLAIVKDYDLLPEVLGFEVTMVPGERDVERMREEMRLLRGQQIVFVLTDVDPTTVNFEAVMKLPFEMIKFERHCIKRASEQTMYYDVVGTLVDLFREQGFLVAFKGIDNVQLEEVAISLGADFLQGEKYTKPFPVERIEEQSDLEVVF